MANLNSGLGVDDVYIGVNPPQAVLGAGQTTASAGIVGVASWGPKNTPVMAGAPQDILSAFGPPVNSGKDLVQDAVVFMYQRPLGGVVGVRVSDGTDVAAAAVLNDSTPLAGLELTAKYTGTFGNQITVTLQQGSNYSVGAPTWKLSVQAGKFRPEVWDRIPGVAAAGANNVWSALLNALNNGTDALHPASKFVTATLPGVPSTVLPNTAAQTVAFTGGTNGGVPTTGQQLGVDGGSGARTGLFALRGMGIAVAWLAGNTDATSWETLLTFRAAEDCAVGGAFPAGTTPSAARDAKVTAGIDDPQMFLALGTFVFLDTNLGQNVSLTQVPAIAGVYCSTKSHESPGNRVVYGCVGTEQTLGANPQPYSRDDMTLLENNGIIFVTSPIPGANAFGVRHGKNTSSNFATSELAYTHKTNDLVKAFQGPVMGQFVNRLQTTRANDPLREAVEAAFRAYLGPQASGTDPAIDWYDVRCDLTNNPVAQINAGVMQADITVKYLSVVNQFIINLTAGQTVQVVVNTLQTAA